MCEDDNKEKNKVKPGVLEHSYFHCRPDAYFLSYHPGK